MQSVVAMALFLGLTASLFHAQQPGPAAANPDKTAEQEPVYSVGPGVTAPELVSATQLLSASKCKGKDHGTVAFSFYVDETGVPREITFVRVLGTDLDRLALLIVGKDRFKPGTRDGRPAAVSQQAEVSLEACTVETKDDTGKTHHALRLRSQPVQKLMALEGNPAGMERPWMTAPPENSTAATRGLAKIGNGVSNPFPLNNVQAEYDDEARKERIEGICLIKVVVDVNGLPQDAKVARGLDPGLDIKAIEAVNKYRFRPAMKEDGTPVPVRITVEVNFRMI
jgi:TonB family protein